MQILEDFQKLRDLQEDVLLVESNQVYYEMYHESDCENEEECDESLNETVDGAIKGAVKGVGAALANSNGSAASALGNVAKGAVAGARMGNSISNAAKGANAVEQTANDSFAKNINNTYGTSYTGRQANALATQAGINSKGNPKQATADFRSNALADRNVFNSKDKQEALEEAAVLPGVPVENSADAKAANNLNKTYGTNYSSGQAKTLMNQAGANSKIGSNAGGNVYDPKKAQAEIRSGALADKSVMKKESLDEAEILPREDKVAELNKAELQKCKDLIIAYLKSKGVDTTKLEKAEDPMFVTVIKKIAELLEPTVISNN